MCRGSDGDGAAGAVAVGTAAAAVCAVVEGERVRVQDDATRQSPRESVHAGVCRGGVFGRRSVLFRGMFRRGIVTQVR